MRVGKVCAAAVSLMLAACSPLTQTALHNLREGFFPSPLPGEAALPKDTAYLRILVQGRWALLGLGAQDATGTGYWYSAEALVLALHQGMLTHSSGFPSDLLRTQTVAGPVLGSDWSGLTLPVEITRRIDRPDHAAEITTYRLTDDGKEHVTVWGTRLEVRHLRETVLHSNSHDPLPGNQYWLDSHTRTLVQSRQWLAPDYSVLLQPQPHPPVVAVPDPVPAAVPEALTVAGSQRLSTLLQHYELTPTGWPSGVVWLSRAAEVEQGQLKRGVLYDMAQEKDGLSPVVKQRLQSWAAKFSAMPVTGRRSLPVLRPYWLRENPIHDPELAQGDRLLPGYTADDPVVVLGNVPAECTYPVAPDLKVVDLLHRCLAGASVPDWVYLIRAGGNVQALPVAVWNRGQPHGLMPGDRVFVPFTLSGALAGNPDAGLDMARFLATQVQP